MPQTRLVISAVVAGVARKPGWAGWEGGARALTYPALLWGWGWVWMWAEGEGRAVLGIPGFHPGLLFAAPLRGWRE